MKSKKPLIIVVVVICMLVLAVPVLEKYFEMEDERCIQFVKEMQYPGYGNITLDQALRNIGGTPCYTSDGERVVVEVFYGSTHMVMAFIVDMKNDIEYLDFCSLDGNSLGGQEAQELLRMIYSNTLYIQE